MGNIVRFIEEEPELTLPIDFLKEVKRELVKYIKVCNVEELGLVIKGLLVEYGLPPIAPSTFKNYFYGNVSPEIKISKAYEEFKELIQWAAINAKVELMEDYESESTDWTKKGKIEFLLDRKFKNFGLDKEVVVDTENTKTIGGIVINIDNRSLNINPVTTENQMLEGSDNMIDNYLIRRNILELPAADESE